MKDERTSSGIVVKLDYAPEGAERAGEYPYTRGIQPTMYRGAALDDAAVMQGWGMQRSRTGGTSFCWNRGLDRPAAPRG